MLSVLVCLLLQSPAPQPHPHPAPHGDWARFHGQRLEVVRGLHPGIVVVENPTAQVYAEVVNGVVVQTYTLQPVAAVAVAPVAPVVVERPRPWYRFWRR